LARACESYTMFYASHPHGKAQILSIEMMPLFLPIGTATITRDVLSLETQTRHRAPPPPPHRKVANAEAALAEEAEAGAKKLQEVNLDLQAARDEVARLTLESQEQVKKVEALVAQLEVDSKVCRPFGSTGMLWFGHRQVLLLVPFRREEKAALWASVRGRWDVHGV